MSKYRFLSILSLMLLGAGGLLLIADSAPNFPQCDGVEEVAASFTFVLNCSEPQADGATYEYDGDLHLSIVVDQDDAEESDDETHPGIRHTIYVGYGAVPLRTLLVSDNDSVNFEAFSLFSDDYACESSADRMAQILALALVVHVDDADEGLTQDLFCNELHLGTNEEQILECDAAEAEAPHCTLSIQRQ